MLCIYSFRNLQNLNIISSLCKIKSINNTSSKRKCFNNRSISNAFSNYALNHTLNKLPISKTIFNTSATNATKVLNRVYKTPIRFFAKQHKSYSDSSDDEEPDLIDKYDKNCKTIKSHMASLRLDSILKSGLGLSRNKVDTAFYESRIRVNGEKVLKKSQRVSVGDEVDVIKGFSAINPNVVSIGRVEIISAKADEEEEEIIVKMKRFKTLQIENYKTAPYKQRDTT